MSYKLALIGSPVYHSKSPDIYARIFSGKGIDGSFSVLEINDLRDIRRIMTVGAFDAFAITMPYKRDIIRYLDCISAEAEELKSVNFVTVKKGIFTGYSTDGAGFTAGLEDVGFNPSGKRFLIYGYGGAASCVCRALKKQSAAVSVCGRNERKAKGFAENQGCSFDFLENACSYDAFVNATPLGMTGFEQFSDFSFLNGTKAGFLVYDLVYSPIRTELIRQAAVMGLIVQNGASMLKNQALAAFSLLKGD